MWQVKTETMELDRPKTTPLSFHMKMIMIAFSLASYGDKIRCVSRKWKKIIADFHVLGLFIGKKYDLNETKLSGAVER
jgi:hypothetical protein